MDVSAPSSCRSKSDSSKIHNIIIMQTVASTDIATHPGIHEIFWDLLAIAI